MTSPYTRLKAGKLGARLCQETPYSVLGQAAALALTWVQPSALGHHFHAPAGVDKVHECKKLAQVILDWRPCQKDEDIRSCRGGSVELIRGMYSRFCTCKQDAAGAVQCQQAVDRLAASCRLQSAYALH